MQSIRKFKLSTAHLRHHVGSLLLKRPLLPVRTYIADLIARDRIDARIQLLDCPLFYLTRPRRRYTPVSNRQTSPSRTTRPAVGPAKWVPITSVDSIANCASIRRRVDSAAF